MKQLRAFPFSRLLAWLFLAANASPEASGGTLNKNATLVSEGTTRYWDYYVPDNLSPKAQVVAVLHGGGQDKDQILDPLRVSPAKEWLRIADEHKVIVIFPNGVNVATGLGTGTNLSWNDARNDNSTTSTKDDILFFNLLLDWAGENFDVAEHRIYFTGSSNGGLMSYRVAQEMSHRVAAVAAFIANKPALDGAGDPEFPISVSICNGQGETLYMPWAGGYVSGNVNAGTVLSAPATRDYWVNVNGCATTPQITPFPNLDPADGSVASRLLHTGGTDLTEVELIVVGNGGHVIPSIAHPYNPANLNAQGLGIQNRDLEGARVAWAFLSRQTLGRTRPTTFAGWMAEQGFTDPLADPDGDGINHLLTYVTGADLAATPRDRLPAVGIATFNHGGDDSRHVTFTYHLRNDASGFNLALQCSPDLDDWQDATPSLVTVQTTDKRDGTTSIVMREAAPLANAPGARFYRIAASAIP
jgi:polyhydroxybutyrate depolymerase